MSGDTKYGAATGGSFRPPTRGRREVIGRRRPAAAVPPPPVEPEPRDAQHPAWRGSPAPSAPPGGFRVEASLVAGDTWHGARVEAATGGILRLVADSSPRSEEAELLLRFEGLVDGLPDRFFATFHGRVLAATVRQTGVMVHLGVQAAEPRLEAMRLLEHLEATLPDV